MTWRRIRRSRSEMLGEAPPLANWPAPDLTKDVREDKRTTYQAQKLAVELWVNEAPESTIKKRCGLEASRVREMVRRAVSINPRTRAIVGFWACVPNFVVRRPTNIRTKPFNPAERSDGKGMTGVLDLFFQTHPGIHKNLVEFVRKRRTEGSAPVALLSPKAVHEVFIGQCREHGLEGAGGWPFNADRRGYEAVRRWYKRERWKAPIRAASNAHGDAAGNLANIDFQLLGKSSARRRLMAYEHTQLDEHYMDAMWEVGYPLPGGQFASITTTRLWALVMSESRSTAVLSSTVSWRERYDRADVMRLILRALEPPKRYQLRVDGDVNYQYREGAAYPGELPEFTRFGWNQLSFDADISHVSPATISAICDVVGCRPSSERVGAQPARVIIEGFFGYLTQMLKRSPAATGNRPDSPARRDPEAAALRYRLFAFIAEEFLDLVCRNYNSTPSTACDGLTPLSLLRELLSRGECYRMPIGAVNEANLWRLLPMHRATLTKSRGVGPLGVNLFGARYVSKDLAADHELMYAQNTAVSMYVEEDGRFAIMVPDACPTKHFRLATSGKYAEEAHPLALRRATTAYTKNAGIQGKADGPQLMYGFGVLAAQSKAKDAATVTMLSATAAFKDREKAGVLQYIGSDDEERSRLIEYASRQAVDNDEEGEGGEKGATEPIRPLPPHNGGKPPAQVFDPFKLL